MPTVCLVKYIIQYFIKNINMNICSMLNKWCPLSETKRNNIFNFMKEKAAPFLLRTPRTRLEVPFKIPAACFKA